MLYFSNFYTLTSASQLYCSSVALFFFLGFCRALFFLSSLSSIFTFYLCTPGYLCISFNFSACNFPPHLLSLHLYSSLFLSHMRDQSVSFTFYVAKGKKIMKKQYNEKGTGVNGKTVLQWAVCVLAKWGHKLMVHSFFSSRLNNFTQNWERDHHISPGCTTSSTRAAAHSSSSRLTSQKRGSDPGIGVGQQILDSK